MKELTARDRVDLAIDEIRRARCGPAYIYGLLRLDIKESEQSPTMDVDGRTLRYNAEFVNGLAQGVLDFWTLHESTHTLLRHPQLLRMLKRKYPGNEEEIRIALEFVANSVCRASGIGTPPKDAFWPENHGLAADMEEEWYIRKLIAKKEQEKPDDDGDDRRDPGQSDSGTDMDDDTAGGSGAEEEDGENEPDQVPPDTDGEQEADGGDSQEGQSDSGESGPASDDQAEGGAAQDSDDAEAAGTPPEGAGDSDPDPLDGYDEHSMIRDLIEAPEEDCVNPDLQVFMSLAEASAIAKSCGLAPAWLENKTAVFSRRNRNLPRQKLRTFMQSAATSYSWACPDRRHGEEMVFPGKGGGSDIKNIAVCIDVSGSTMPYRQHFLELLVSEGRRYPQARFVIVPWDTRVFHEEVKILEGAKIPKTQNETHCGGTRVAPVFDWVKANQGRYMFKGAVILTDGEFYDLPERKPSYPILWVLAGERAKVPKWGANCFLED